MKTLPPKHSISFRGTTCGIDSANGIACIDPRGGAFLLTAGWAGWLDHVTRGQTVTVAPLSCNHNNDTTTCRQDAHGLSFTSKPGSYQGF